MQDERLDNAIDLGCVVSNERDEGAGDGERLLTMFEAGYQQSRLRQAASKRLACTEDDMSMEKSWRKGTRHADQQERGSGHLFDVGETFSMWRESEREIYCGKQRITAAVSGIQRKHITYDD